MASSTWDGSRDPEVQAEPLEAQIPLLSSRIRSDSPSINWKLKLALLGSRVRGMSVKPAVGDLRQHPVDQVIPQPDLLPAPLFHGVSRKAGRRPKPYDARHIFRSCPALSLLGCPRG